MKRINEILFINVKICLHCQKGLPAMIQITGSYYLLDTQHTTYCFRAEKHGFLQHLYYGKRLRLGGNPQVLVPQASLWPGDASGWRNAEGNVCLEDMALEISAPGLGDLREPFVQVRTASGGLDSDFRFESAEILEGKPALDGLPSSCDAVGMSQTLRVVLEDQRASLRLELFYTTFDDCDVITRSARLTNLGEAPAVVLRLMSNQIDFYTQDLVMTAFNGAWGREFEPVSTPCGPGTVSGGSRTGTSSSKANPFVMLHDPHADEEHGCCYGFHLIYSGDHRECACGNAYGKLRFLHGISPENFSWQLGSGEYFTAPEAAMTWGWGFSDMSVHLHSFIREHVLRGMWQNRPRPVLVNSWESFYFTFTHDDLLRLAEQAKSLGAELFVLDDGWFGKRDDASCSLGDWTEVNRKKLPFGLDALAGEIRALGLDFGLWVEPEMVSEDSNLYRAHPDWILGRSGQAIGRNQFVLDMGREDVQQHLIHTLSDVFSSARPAYIKWDMNRILTDTWSAALPCGRQGESRHRYVLGLYRVLSVLTKRFPHILFECCAGGGNRTDLGMLCYMPQVWLSDNTDALCRCRMQYHASFGYPQCVWGSHVSASPNHQTLRDAPIDSRFHIAALGLLGYELDLGELSEEDREAVKSQITFYKKYRDTLQFGQLYRLRNGSDGFWEMMAVSSCQKTALALLFQPENHANAPALRLLSRGLREDAVYRLTVRSVPGGETEDVSVTGNVLDAWGVWLKQGFCGVGRTPETRVMGDSGSRLYVLEEQ